jgi:hypothetical protein
MDQAAQKKTIIKPSIAYFLGEGENVEQKLKETNLDTSYVLSCPATDAGIPYTALNWST